MPSMSFAADSTPESEAQWAAAPKQELAKPQGGPVSGISGEVTSRDIKLPRLNLIQKMSAAVDAGFKAGDILFKNGDTILPLALPTEVTILNLKKQYQEALPYGSTELPRTFDTAAELRAHGFTTEYGQEGYCKEIATLQVLFPAPPDLPEEMLDLFQYNHDGQDYGIALMTLAGSAYTAGAKPIITAFMSHLRGKHWTGKWTLASEKRTGGGNTWHVPTFKMAGKHDEAFAEFALGLLPE